MSYAIWKRRDSVTPRCKGPWRATAPIAAATLRRAEDQGTAQRAVAGCCQPGICPGRLARQRSWALQKKRPAETRALQGSAGEWIEALELEVGRGGEQVAVVGIDDLETVRGGGGQVQGVGCAQIDRAGQAGISSADTFQHL